VTTVCESFNRYDCVADCNMTATVCMLVAPIYRAQCFVLWNIDTAGHLTILRKDCTSDNMDCYDQHQCIEMENHRGKNGDAYCCCEGNMCNADFHPMPKNSTGVYNSKIPGMTMRLTFFYG
jgi:Activin types I and II receptor domain